MSKGCWVALLLILALASISQGAGLDDIGCARGRCDGGGAPRQDKVGITIPFSGIVEIAAHLLAVPLPTGASLAIPDIDIEFSREVTADPNPWVACDVGCCDGEGRLRMWNDVVFYGGKTTSDAFGGVLSATARYAGDEITDGSERDEDPRECQIMEEFSVHRGSCSVALTFAPGASIPITGRDIEIVPAMGFELYSSCREAPNRPPGISLPPSPIRAPAGGSVDIPVSVIDPDGDKLHVSVVAGVGALASLRHDVSTDSMYAHVELTDHLDEGSTIHVIIDAYDLLGDPEAVPRQSLTPANRGRTYSHHVHRSVQVEVIGAVAPATPTVDVQFPRSVRSARISLTITNPGRLLSSPRWYELPSWADASDPLYVDDPVTGIGALAALCTHMSPMTTHITIHPESMEIGKHTLPYQVTNSLGLRSTGEVIIEITNSLPVAKPDDFTNIGSGMPVGVAIDTTETITCDVLANDTDADGDTLVAKLVEGSGPLNGVLSLEENDSFTYTPNAGFVGKDSFEYRAFDGSDYSEPAVVTLTVHANPNRPPMMAVDELDESELASLPAQDDRRCGVRVFLADPDLDTEWYIERLTLDVSFSVSGPGNTSADLYWKEAAENEWSPLKASLVFTSPEVIDISLVPDAGVRSATLNLDLIDSQGERDARAIRWNNINTPPDVKVGDSWLRVGSYATRATCHMRGPAMLTMDPEWYDVGCLQFRDLDGDALIFRVSPKPDKGRADLLVAGGGGRYSVSILYTIDREEALKDHRGEEPYVDRFSVVATDPSGEKAISNVEVTLEVLNSDPECAPDEAETFAGVPVLIDAVANDTDPDEDTLTITAVGDPAHGATEIVGNEIRYTPDTGYCGEDAFTYDVGDGYGGSATGTVTAVVLDTIPPMAVCQDATVFLDANGIAALDPAVLNDGSTDNCGIAAFTADPDTFSCNDVGTRPVTLTVIDHAGNTATCQATVTVIDAIAPVAAGEDVEVSLDASGRVTVDAYAVGATSTDNCAITSLALSQIDFTCADLGANTVALTATDPSGNTDACTITVTVVDVIPPVAESQNLTVSLDADGIAVLDPASVGAPSTDNCAIAGYTLDRDTFTCADIGEHTVTLTVTDLGGLTDVCQATITVVDDLPPSIACPGSIFTAVSGSETSKVATWNEPTVVDNCGVLGMTSTHTPGDRFPIGSTTVQYTATDIHGNVGTCTFNVNVAEPLSLSCSDVSVTTPDPRGTNVTFNPSVEGGCNPRVTCTPSSGSHFPVGTTQVNCTATGDCSGSDSCIFTVEVLFVNQAPWAFDDEVDMPESGGCLTIPVLANDSDPDGHAVFVSWVGSPSCGTTAIVSEGGAIEYCTEGCSDPPETVTFDYRISDGYAESANATVSVDMPSGPIILFCPPPDEEGKE